jgi:hypothetical protein
MVTGAGMSRIPESGIDLGTAEAKRDSGKALLCSVDDLGRDIWVPHSQIHEDSEVFDCDENKVGRLVVTRWFAEKEKLA